MKAKPNLAPTNSKVKLTSRQSWYVLIGLMIGLGGIWTACDSLLSENISAEAKRQYDSCVMVQQQAGDGIIDADSKCDYLKRQ